MGLRREGWDQEGKGGGLFINTDLLEVVELRIVSFFVQGSVCVCRWMVEDFESVGDMCCVKHRDIRVRPE